MRVYLSGGPNRTQQWGSLHTKKEMQAKIREINPRVEFVKSGQSDFIVVPDDDNFFFHGCTDMGK